MYLCGSFKHTSTGWRAATRQWSCLQLHGVLGPTGSLVDPAFKGLLWSCNTNETMSLQIEMQNQLKTQLLGSSIFRMFQIGRVTGVNGCTIFRMLIISSWCTRWQRWNSGIRFGSCWRFRWLSTPGSTWRGRWRWRPWHVTADTRGSQRRWLAHVNDLIT